MMTLTANRGRARPALAGLLAGFALALNPNAGAQESVCAEVKIEIQQELTLERQAFEARMVINNGLDDLSLDNVVISVNFTDENGAPVLATSDPNNTSAAFFIRVDTLDNIGSINGGTISPGTSAEIRWLIVPAPGAASNSPGGKLYFVGANLSYVFGGVAESVDVEPDFITVRPLPQLVLDYFLTQYVFADDAFTPEIEPPEPFTLGVRVQNNGSGDAQNVTIDSAQPTIVENEQGLLINFEITGSEVNNQPAEPTLLINFGEIPSGGAATGRWFMQTTLSGEFTEFSAEFSHADELGGALTSLIDSTRAHLLVRDVLVDVPGRDAVIDFLADDTDGLRVYESDNVDTEVTDQSGSAAMVFTGQAGGTVTYTMETPDTAGFMYVQLPDPFNGTRVVSDAIRLDGKRIPLQNVWFSKVRGNGNQYSYFINLFDANSSADYRLTFGGIEDIPRPPVLQFIPDRNAIAGSQIGFIVEASDPNGTIPVLTASGLPVGASFTDQGDGTGVFAWQSQAADAGNTYEITYVASDGALTASQKARITLVGFIDSDGDGMDDQWELDFFGTLDRDGTGDFDGDGISDLDEFLAGTDPTRGSNLMAPALVSPLYGDEVDALTPVLTVALAEREGNVTATYDFEVYADASMQVLVASEVGIPEPSDATDVSWQVNPALLDNTEYFWRARANDGVLYSPWTVGNFFVNTVNDAPAIDAISAPLDGAQVDTLTPVLVVNNATDIDRDTLTYDFTIWTDEFANVEVTGVSGVIEGADGTTQWLVPVPLVENTLYYWDVTARDADGAQATTALSSFFVNVANDAPLAPTVVLPLDGAEVASSSVTLSADGATDPDADPLVYQFEIDLPVGDGVDTLASPDIVANTGAPTTWTVDGLLEDTVYQWRVRASDLSATSPWVARSFFVNAVNAAPSVPTAANPGDGSWVDLLSPVLVVNPSTDPDSSTISYEFEIYSDAGLTVLLSQGSTPTPEWQVPIALEDNTFAYWRARAVDDLGAVSAWGEVSSFFVDDNGVNDAPQFAWSLPAGDITVTDGPVRLVWSDSDPDNDAQIALEYVEIATGAVGPIATALSEDADGADDEWLWDITGLAAGSYEIRATIDDGNSQTTVTAPGRVEILSPVVIVTVDNDDAQTGRAGAWNTSTAVAGYLGADYEVAEASGGGLSFIIDDEDAAGFSADAGWKSVASSESGVVGTGYSYVSGVPGPVSVSIDNTDPEFKTYAPWTSSTDGSGFAGSDFAYLNAIMERGDAEWVFTPPQTGIYDIKARVGQDWLDATPVNGAPRAFSAYYIVFHDPTPEATNGATLVTSSHVSNPSPYRELGSYPMTAGKSYRVVLMGSFMSFGLLFADEMLFTQEAVSSPSAWSFTVGTDGPYALEASWPALPGNSTATTFDIVEIFEGTLPSGETFFTETVLGTVVADQTQTTGTWNALGTFDLRSFRRYEVRVSNYGSGRIIADAIQVTEADVAPSEFSWTLSTSVAGNYDIQARWPAAADHTAAARFEVDIDGTLTAVTVDQSMNGGEWVSLRLPTDPVFTLNAGAVVTIRLTDSGDGKLIADAVRLVSVP